MKNLQTLVKIAAAFGVATVGILSATQPVLALAKYTFEFQDQNGSTGGSGEYVRGEITFDSLTSGSIIDGDYAPDSIVVTQIPAFMATYWEDNSGFDLNVNLIPLAGNGTFNSNDVFTIANNSIVDSAIDIMSDAQGSEGLHLISSESGLSAFDGSLFSEALDGNNSSLTFSAASTSAAVPFEFSPSLGLLLVGGVFGVSRYVKTRKANKVIENA